MILETERLYLRQMDPSDLGDLRKILQDEEAMYAYEGAFSDSSCVTENGGSVCGRRS